MATSLNRTAVLLDLIAFVGLSLFCIGTKAPIIQQDILKRCQDTLMVHHIPVKGLSVDGRDVIVSGSPGSLIVSPRAYSILAEIPGVRAVSSHVSSIGSKPDPFETTSSFGHDDAAFSSATGSESGNAGPSSVQEKLDRLLDNQPIRFKADATVLLPESESALDKVAADLAGAPNLLCEIRGYDTQPGELHQNWVLALQRALAIEDYLEMKGVATSRLSARAFHMGEAADGRRSDRPIDLVVRTRD